MPAQKRTQLHPRNLGPANAALAAIYLPNKLKRGRPMRSEVGAAVWQPLVVPGWGRQFFHAPSNVRRIGDAIVGRGVYVRCSACHNNGHHAPDAALDELMCAAGVRDRAAGRRGDVVFKAGDLVGWYTGKKVDANAVGDYVVHLVVVPWSCGVDAQRRGSVLRFMNGSQCETAANVRFGSDKVHTNLAGRINIPVYATRVIRTHDELVADYGKKFSFNKSKTR